MTEEELVLKINDMELDEWQMQQVKLAFHILSPEQIDLLLNPAYSYRQMEQLRIALMDGIAPDVVKAEMNTDVRYTDMQKVRIREMRGMEYRMLAESIGKLEKDIQERYSAELQEWKEQCHKLKLEIQKLHEEKQCAENDEQKMAEQFAVLEEAKTELEEKLKQEEDTKKQVEEQLICAEADRQELTGCLKLLKEEKTKLEEELKQEYAAKKQTEEQLTAKKDELQKLTAQLKLAGEEKAELETELGSIKHKLQEKVVHDEQPEQPKRGIYPLFKRKWDLNQIIMHTDFDANQLKEIRLALEDELTEEQMKTIVKKKLDAGKMCQLRQYYDMVNRKNQKDTIADSGGEQQSGQTVPPVKKLSEPEVEEESGIPEGMYLPDEEWRRNYEAAGAVDERDGTSD